MREEVVRMGLLYSEEKGLDLVYSKDMLSQWPNPPIKIWYVYNRMHILTSAERIGIKSLSTFCCANLP